MSISLKQKTIKGMFWSFFDTLANSGISLIIQIFLARLLLPADFGIIGIVTVLISIAQTIIESGFTNALIRDLKTSQEDYSTIFYFNLIVSATLYIVLFLSANMISIFYSEPRLIMIIRVLSLVLIISSFGLIQRTMLTKIVNFRSQALINMITSIISGIVAILFAINGLGVWSLVYYSIIRQILQSIMYSAVNRWHPSFMFSLKSLKRFYSFGWKLLMSSLIDTISVNLNSLVIGKLFTKDILGYYTNASKLSSVVSQSLNGAIGKVSYSVLSQMQEDEERLRSGYKQIILNMVFLNFPLVIGLIAIAEPLIMLLLGEKWAQVIPYFQLLCVPGIISPLQSINLEILQVKGRSDLFLKITVLKRIISILLIVIIIIFRRGMIDLLLIGVFDACITYFINSHYSAQLLGYSSISQIRDVTPTLVAAIFMAIIIFGFGYFLPFGLIIELPLQIIIGVISYVILCKIFRIKELNEALKLIGGSIKRK